MYTKMTKLMAPSGKINGEIVNLNVSFDCLIVLYTLANTYTDVYKTDIRSQWQFVHVHVLSYVTFVPVEEQSS